MAVEFLTNPNFDLMIKLLSFLFGSGVVIWAVKAVRSYFRIRMEEDRGISEYLQQSAIFLEGLPYFITHTWAWGPSVPNYGAGGSFPSETPFVLKSMPSVYAAVSDAVALYIRHSQTQGTPFSTIDEALRHLKEIDFEFWESVEVFAKARWPLRWRVKVSQLRALQIPITEYDRIRNFKANRK